MLAYLLALLSLLVLDALWLGVLARDFYQTSLGALLRPDFDPWAAGVFYLVYVAGLFHFAVRPARRTGAALHAVRDGALLGGLAYATYELTNLATLPGWPLRVVVVDVLWGAALSALVALVGYLVAGRGRRSD